MNGVMLEKGSSISRAALLIVLLWTAPAFAQPICNDRSIITNHLEVWYGERQRVVALINDDLVLEVFIKPDRSKWTLLLTGTEGSCMLLYGDDWQELTIERGG